MDAYFERRVGHDELRAALSAVLGATEIDIIDDYGDLRPVELTALVWPTHGDFLTHVRLESARAVGPAEIRALGAALDTTAITPDDASSNPYAYRRFTPAGDDDAVAIQAVDDEDVIRLYRP